METAIAVAKIVHEKNMHDSVVLKLFARKAFVVSGNVPSHWATPPWFKHMKEEMAVTSTMTAIPYSDRLYFIIQVNDGELNTGCDKSNFNKCNFQSQNGITFNAKKYLDAWKDTGQVVAFSFSTPKNGGNRVVQHKRRRIKGLASEYKGQIPTIGIIKTFDNVDGQCNPISFDVMGGKNAFDRTQFTGKASFARTMDMQIADVSKFNGTGWRAVDGQNDHLTLYCD